MASRCYDCHTDAKSGGLRLDSRESMLSGGKSGPAIKPGDPDNSLLIQAIRRTHARLKMPPGAKLEDAQIEAIATWIKNGAGWPAGPAKPVSYVITKEQRDFWAFRPVSAPPIPAVKNAKWVRDSIDNFILSKLEEKGLAPVQPAAKRTLIRRATLDLTGLPPTPEEVDAFVADKSPDAYAKVVDRLLASPRYGERWGRYWLDVARYSDDKLNSTEDEPYKNSFRYRDWVINAFNEDMPWDRFVKAQIAGDMMPEPEKYRPGLGFYSLSPEMQDDRVDATARGFMGLTVACAQCHNHKFDPIPQSDYYSMLGIFANTSLSEFPLASKEEVDRYKAADKKVAEKKKAISEFLKQEADGIAGILAARTADYLLATAGAGPETGLDPETLGKWRKYLNSPEKDHPFLKPWYAATSLAEKQKAARDFEDLVLAAIAEKKTVDDKNHIILGLDPSRSELSQANLVSMDRDRFVLWEQTYGKGVLRYSDDKVQRFLAGPWKEHLDKLNAQLAALKKEVPPQYPFLQVIADKDKLAEQKLWIRGDRNNPGEPTPRHFVSILSKGEPQRFNKGAGRLELAEAIADPANPLTARVIVNRVWQHHFGQAIVRTPSNFGLQGDRPSHPELLDHLAAQFVKDGWSIKLLHRRIMLSAAYQSGTEPNEKNLAADPENRLLWRYNRQRLDAEALRDGLLFVAGRLDFKQGGLGEHLSKDNVRRTVYCFVSRRKLDSDFALFDFPNPNNTSEQRPATNVPPQRLYFMNNEWVISQAKAVAGRLTGPDEAKVTQIYRLLFQRAPEKKETELALQFLRSAGDKAWQEYAQVLMTSNEFQFLD
ncbi:MAG TPA: PSD1 and planctomycete cytochrome C domain-containing protein [Bryobacteraceae bacterium]|nr:PSD1 and planctomycete cytochrome C domain-containing protein [Bryobacteraceae bacterium]